MLRLIVYTERKYHDLMDDRKGVTAMEYGIIAAVTVVVVGAAVATLTGPLTTIWSKIGAALVAAA